MYTKIKFNPLTNIIYIDMDGVLADFNKFIIEHTGRPFDYYSPDGDPEMWDFLESSDHLFLKLDTTPYAYDLIAAAYSITDNVQILTALPTNISMPTAMQDKIDWVEMHFGPDIKVNFGPEAGDKWTHAAPGDILIDDREDNIEDWISKGRSLGILHNIDDYDSTVKLLHAITQD
jgi:5'(3')-deoxyribonucleotidase